MKNVLFLIAVSLLSGCFIDGANGDQGVVRFSQMVNYKETDGFSARIATGRSILVRLEHADTSASSQQRQDGFPELMLKVDGGGHRIFPLGFGQFAVQFDAAGSAALTAVEGEKEVDRLKVNVAAMRGLRFSTTAHVVTKLKDVAGDCARVETVKLDGFTLKKNQTLRLDAIPLDDDGKPMIGFLSVRATSSSAVVQLDTPLFFEGAAPNTLVVEPAAKLGDTVTITALETSGLTAELVLPTSDDEATGTCN